MTSKHVQRSEETKRSILNAAGMLFAQKGYEAVTMREIAKAASCSHTAIYIYFKDKEALLHELSMPHLHQLKEEMIQTLNQMEWPPETKLVALSRKVIRFCIEHRNMYALIFSINADRVDEKEPKLAINKLRIELYGLLRQTLQQCLPKHTSDELSLLYSRIYFYTLYGIAGSYQYSSEDYNQLMERLGDTFEEAFQVLLTGMNQRMAKGAEKNES